MGRSKHTYKPFDRTSNKLRTPFDTQTSSLHLVRRILRATSLRTSRHASRIFLSRIKLVRPGGPLPRLRGEETLVAYGPSLGRLGSLNQTGNPVFTLHCGPVS